MVKEQYGMLSEMIYMNFDLVFLIAQFFGIIAIIFNKAIVHFNTKEKMLITMIISNLAVALQFFLLNAITGGIVSLINVFRCIVLYLFKKYDKKPSILVLVIFEVIVIISGIISWQNIWSILPIIATLTYTYAIWQDDVLKIKYVSLLVGLEWAIYSIIVRAYAGFIQEVMQVISSIVAVARYKKKT